jgi:hypothetical protein
MVTIDYYVIAGVILVAILGGVVAYTKKDYVTRGMAICLFTYFWGLLALILSPASKARSGEQHDEHRWPPLSWLAVGGTILTVFAVKLAHWICSG